MIRSVSSRLGVLFAAATALCAGRASAMTFTLDYVDGLEGTLNSVVTAGAAWRMQGRSHALVGKANLNPYVCDAGGHAPGDSRYQNCQGVFKDQSYPAAALARAPGQASPNFDDGNWNYDKHDLVEAPIKLVQDLNLKYGDFGLFAKWYWFYDAVNENFTEFHPNMITEQNRARVAKCAGQTPLTCTNANPLFLNGTYGSGLPTHQKRRGGEILREIGTDLQLFDAYIYGKIPLWDDHEVNFKLGRQTINWGESTVLLINSVNQVNPVNANNLFRVGFDLSELFTPTGMLSFSTQVFDGATVEAYYGYEWEPLETPAPGSFFAFNDIVGVHNAVDNAGINFGGAAEDPHQLATPQDNPLSGLTNTSVTLKRIKDNEPDGTNQYGVALKYYAESVNNGTEFGFYFENYDSKLPYASFYAATESCARKGGVHGSALGTGIPGLDIDATNGAELLAACPDLPILHPADPENATSNAVPIDSVKLQVEYPENIQLYGLSFSTNFGDLALQGEVAYRPALPVQVDSEDLVFAALNPMLTRCGELKPTPVTCLGSHAGVGTGPDGNKTLYGPSDFGTGGTVYKGHTAYTDTFDLAIGAADGSARSFPSFILAYRGIDPGEQPGTDRTRKLDHHNPGYIRGWENFETYQFNLGGTYIQGASDNPIGADQLIWVFEVGAQYVPGLPDTDKLQVETFGTTYHASAGADGSHTGKYHQDCAHTPDCVLGPDGLRFNPHQENPDGYPDNFSAGYAIVSIIRYESVFPGISFQPTTIFQHDVIGTSVDVAQQFTEGRKDIQFILETRYKESFSFNVGYYWFTGAGKYNSQADRDTALVFAKYQF